MISSVPDQSLSIKEPHNHVVLAAALCHAGKGIPVFPLHSVDDTGTCTCGGPEVNLKCSPGKHPRTRNGHNDATTDPGQIARWWEKWPDANVGGATGRAGGFWVLDVDDHRSLEILETEHGRLPKTTAVKTGRGHLHLYFRYPEGKTVRNSVDKVGPGLDVRGDGGYAVLPPSVTQERYEVTEKAPLAAPPDWLSEAICEAPGGSTDQFGKESKPRSSRPRVNYDGTIPEGVRNASLTSFAGRLRAWGQEEAEMLETLSEINQHRCDPPLPDPEVASIARSVCRYPAGTARGASRKAGPEVLGVLRTISRALLNHREWRGMGGKTERDVVAALVMVAEQYGESIPAGVRVSISYRDLAILAACSLKTVARVIPRLKQKGVLRADNAERSLEEAGALVLLGKPTAQGVYTLNHERQKQDGLVGVDTLRAPRLRWSTADVRRLGKTCGAIIDHLAAAAGETLEVGRLAKLMGSGRPRDLKRRVISRLVVAEVVILSGDVISLAPDWLDKLEREREFSGELEAEQRYREKYSRDREAYRSRGDRQPDPVPEPPPLSASLSNADGDLSELESVEYVGASCGATDPESTATVPETARCLPASSPTTYDWQRPTREELREFWAVPRKARHYYPERYGEGLA